MVIHTLFLPFSFGGLSPYVEFLCFMARKKIYLFIYLWDETIFFFKLRGAGYQIRILKEKNSSTDAEPCTYMLKLFSI